MLLLLCSLLASPSGGDCPTPQDQPSFLYQPAYCLDDVLREPPQCYIPQPGDLFLATERDWKLRLAHKIALIGPPHHSGIVVARPDGSLALLEAGPHQTLHVFLSDLLPQLCSYPEDGDEVWIRCRRIPLIPEQSAQLTAFAVAQEGKPFALLRVLIQGTPCRPRGPLKTWWMGKPKYDRHDWYCSELVIEACVAAGLLDHDTARPSATCPRDLFFKGSRNLYLNHHLDLASGWFPPARWLPHLPTDVPELYGQKGPENWNKRYTPSEPWPR